jgi:hypothetical protein
MSDERCGTDAGYQAHQRKGETACAFCKSARAARQKQRREDPAVARRNAEQNAARDAALKVLGHRYREEYQRLYTAALAELRGVDLKRGAA